MNKIDKNTKIQYIKTNIDFFQFQSIVLLSRIALLEFVKSLKQTRSNVY